MDKGFCAIPLKACKLPVKFFVNLRGQYLSLQGRVGATISKTTCVEVSANCFRNSFVTRLLIPRTHISQGSMCLLGSLEAKAWVSARRKRAVPPWGTPCTCFVEEVGQLSPWWCVIQFQRLSRLVNGLEDH